MHRQRSPGGLGPASTADRAGRGGIEIRIGACPLEVVHWPPHVGRVALLYRGNGTTLGAERPSLAGVVGPSGLSEGELT